MIDPNVGIDIITTPFGVYRDQFEQKSLKKPTVFDCGMTTFLANETQAKEDRYPFSIKWSPHPVTVKNANIIGVQSRDFDWRKMKNDYEGDGIRMEMSGRKVVDGCFIDNVEDGFSPRHSGEWEVANTVMTGIRDDCIENDQLLSGQIRNCLFEGHTFLSYQYGSNANPANFTPPHIKIDDCLIRLIAQPDNRSETDYKPDGKSCGQFFKRSEVGGFIEMRNCVLRTDQWSARGKSQMDFPMTGIYENVTLVWLGDGEYPRPLPPGMTLTTDEEFWNVRMNEWIEGFAQRRAAA